MNTTHREESKAVKIVLITISVLFLVLMLVLPLLSVVINSLREGIKFYFESLSTEYVRSALKVTFLATIWAVAVNTFFGIAASWLLTKFSFKGKPVFGNTDRYPVFHFTGHRRTCVSHDVRKTGLGIRHHRPHQCLFRNRHKDRFCAARCGARNDICNFSVCVAGTDPGIECGGKRGGGSGGAHGNERLYHIPEDHVPAYPLGHCFMEVSYVPRVRSENSGRSMRFPRPEGKRLHCRLRSTHSIYPAQRIRRQRRLRHLRSWSSLRSWC